MKKIYLFLLSLLLAFTAKSQQKLSYEYDAAGNRISRTIVIDTKSASATGNPVDSVFYEETIADKQVSIYPNPVEKQLTIKISGYTPSMQGVYSLYGITGAMVAKRPITGEITHVDMGMHSRGIYILQIILDGQPIALKVIKK